jgi:caffeoyl-CoA O-methyltransferase
MKYTQLNDRIYDYLCQQRSRADDPVLEQLRQETAALGDDSKMMISAEQGSLLTLLVAAIGARNAMEVGTFTGSSSICIARGLPPNGKLTCVDASPEWTAIARKYWKSAGVSEKIELRVGDGRKVVSELRPEAPLDFVFIDADKVGYDFYYETLLPHVRPNGLIVFDNMLWGADAFLLDATESDLALHKLNRKLAADARVEAVLLPVAQGMMICRKK